MLNRVIISAIVLVITNLIVGSISLSLGLLVAVTISVIAVICLISLALLGFCVLLEKLGLVAPGWTDSRIERLKTWALARWRELPAWYKSEKHRIIDMMVQLLKGKEDEAQNPGAAWKSIALGLGFLFGVLVVRQTLHLSIGWSVGFVALASILISVSVLYVSARVSPKQKTNEEPAHADLRPVEPDPAVPSPEVLALWTQFLILHRQGRLKDLLDATAERPSPTESRVTEHRGAE
ncbi:MAG: hypothetical protein AB1646_07420 [Thermodesulfobacteriota bacterium]